MKAQKKNRKKLCVFVEAVEGTSGLVSTTGPDLGSLIIIHTIPLSHPIYTAII